MYTRTSLMPCNASTSIIRSHCSHRQYGPVYPSLVSFSAKRCGTLAVCVIGAAGAGNIFGNRFRQSPFQLMLTPETYFRYQFTPIITADGDEPSIKIFPVLPEMRKLSAPDCGARRRRICFA